METEIIKVVATQGIFALLFVWLLFYVLKENSKREEKYQSIIEALTDKLQILETGISTVQEDVKEIKEKAFR